MTMLHENSLWYHHVNMHHRPHLFPLEAKLKLLTARGYGPPCKFTITTIPENSSRYTKLVCPAPLCSHAVCLCSQLGRLLSWRDVKLLQSDRTGIWKWVKLCFDIKFLFLWRRNERESCWKLAEHFVPIALLFPQFVVFEIERSFIISGSLISWIVWFWFLFNDDKVYWNMCKRVINQKLFRTYVQLNCCD